MRWRCRSNLAFQPARSFLRLPVFDPSDPSTRIDFRARRLSATIRCGFMSMELCCRPRPFSRASRPCRRRISFLYRHWRHQAELSGNNNFSPGGAMLWCSNFTESFQKRRADPEQRIFSSPRSGVGTVDPRTRQQQVSARFKINDQLFLVGDVGVGATIAAW